VFLTRLCALSVDPAEVLRLPKGHKGSATPFVAVAVIVVRGAQTCVVALPLPAGPRRVSVLEKAIEAIRARWHDVVAGASALPNGR
jgi:hypothetical protein